MPLMSSIKMMKMLVPKIRNNILTMKKFITLTTSKLCKNKFVKYASAMKNIQIGTFSVSPAIVQDLYLLFILSVFTFGVKQR